MMLQEIASHRFDNQYRPQPLTPESYALYYDKSTVLVKKNEDETFDLPTFLELKTENVDAGNTPIYLFSMDGRAFYLLDKFESPQGFTWKTIREAMNSTPRHLAFATVTGYQLNRWYESRKYCGKCGNLTVKDDKIRSLTCPSCQQMEHPKIAPAAIVGVTDGNRLLLASYPNYDKHALLAGFVEIGETLEETVRREVMEEVGLRVRNVRYYKSQP